MRHERPPRRHHGSNLPPRNHRIRPRRRHGSSLHRGSHRNRPPRRQQHGRLCLRPASQCHSLPVISPARRQVNTHHQSCSPSWPSSWPRGTASTNVKSWSWKKV